MKNTMRLLAAATGAAATKVLRVFTQSGCGPCKAVIPETDTGARR